MDSPYNDLPVEKWYEKTRQLISGHPLSSYELYEIVNMVWQSIFASEIGTKPFRIGQDLFPRPQVMGYFLHELIPLELSYRYPTLWRRENQVGEKDVVYIPDAYYSIEIKTSSSLGNIYGNRSYTQPSERSKKDKSGYYLAINFQKFNPSLADNRPPLTSIRFGWIDHEDWKGQASATGQQARLSPEVEKFKLLSLPLSEE